MKKRIQKLTWEQFDDCCNVLAVAITKTRRKFDGIYGIPRGGLVLAVKLSHILKIPLILDENKITIKTLICDDISDTGRTLARFNTCKIVTLFWHKDTITKPDFTCEKKNQWISFPWED